MTNDVKPASLTQAETTSSQLQASIISVSSTRYRFSFGSFTFLSIHFPSARLSYPSLPHLGMLLIISSNYQWNSGRTSLLILIQHTEDDHNYYRSNCRPRLNLLLTQSTLEVCSSDILWPQFVHK